MLTPIDADLLADSGFDKPNVGVDFDGVLHSYEPPPPGGEPTLNEDDPPVEGAIDWLLDVARYFYVYVFSSFANTEERQLQMSTWLTTHGFFGIPYTITNEKPPAVAYIDDRAIPFDGPGTFPSVETLTEFQPWWVLSPALPPIGGATREDLAASLGDRAEVMEAPLTDLVGDVVADYGGRLEGLEHRIKQDASIVEKIGAVADEKSLEDAEAAADVKDALRYSAVFPVAGWSQAVIETLTALESKGIKVERIRNYWNESRDPGMRGAPGTYLGVNAVLSAPNGYLFEAQFHTPASFTVNSVVNWGLYRESLDPGLSDADREAIYERMRANLADVEHPEGADSFSWPGAMTAAAPRVKAPPERVPAVVHNRIVAKSLKRADALEQRMADVIQPILQREGRKAAAAFLATVTDHLTAAALEVDGNATMVALRPRPDESEALAAPSGVEASDLHVTLAYLGEVGGDLEPVRAALAPVAARYAPLEGVVAGGGFFGDPGGDGPSILLPDVRGLVEVRVAVTEALAVAKVDYSREHGFQAHLTVTYRADGDGEPEKWPVGAPLHFDALLIVRGDETVFELPLVGVPPLTAAGPPPEPPPWTPPFPDEIIDVDALTAQIRAKTDPVRDAFLEAAMTPALKAAGLAFDVTNPLTAKVLAGSGAKVRDIAETTRLNVMRIIRSAYDNGLSIPQTATAIRAGMEAASKTRATMIARTELASVVNGGSLAATRIVSDATGQGYMKTWLTAPGATYPRHELYPGLDGQTRALDEPFDVGGSSLMYPGDPDGDPGESINCRCALSYGETAPDEAAVAPALDVGGSEANAAANAIPGVEPFDTVSVGTGAPVPGDVIQRIKDFHLDASLDMAIPTTDVGRAVYAAAKDTEGLYKVGDQWTPERQALHEDIIAAHFAGKTVPATGEKTAYFTAGGGASGKSRALFDVAGTDMPLGDLIDRPDVIHIDPDRIKAMLPEYETLKAANDLFAASGVHEESSALARAIEKIAQEKGYSYVLDTTGSSSRFLSKIETAKALQYQTKVTMFSIPTNEAIVRAMLRGDRSGRYVLISALKKAHKGASEALSVWKDSKVIDDWRVYDGTEKAPELVAEGGKGTAPVLWNEQTFNEILTKAHEGPVAIPAPAPSGATELERLMPGPGTTAAQEIDTKRTAFYQRMADRNGIPSAKEYREKLDAAISALVKDAPVRVRVTPASLDSILGDGRFKSQFESKKSGGLFSPEFRADAEKTMFGYERNLDPTLRPIYGYLGGSTPEGILGGVDQYGKIIVNLKNEARGRTTFSLADSLGGGSRGELLPQSLIGSKMPSLAVRVDPIYGRIDPLPFSDATLEWISEAYAEAQIHGGVSVNDIAEVLFDQRFLRDAEAEAGADIERLEGVVAHWNEELSAVPIEKRDSSDVRVLQLDIAQKNLDAARARYALVVNGGESLRSRLDALGIPNRVLPDFGSLDRDRTARLLGR